MSKKNFDDFLKKKDNKNKPHVDWENEKKKWLAHIDKLYKDIQIWLQEYIDTQKVEIEFNDIEIHEEALGTYRVKELMIFIGDSIAKLTPIGTILIGTRGRIDLSGSAGVVKFILANKNSNGPNIEVKTYTSDEERKRDAENEKKKPKPPIEWTWKISSNPPRIKYTELNQDSFLECLMEVIDG